MSYLVPTLGTVVLASTGTWLYALVRWYGWTGLVVPMGSIVSGGLVTLVFTSQQLTTTRGSMVGLMQVAPVVWVASTLAIALPATYLGPQFFAYGGMAAAGLAAVGSVGWILARGVAHLQRTRQLQRAPSVQPLANLLDTIPCTLQRWRHVYGIPIDLRVHGQPCRVQGIDAHQRVVVDYTMPVGERFMQHQPRKQPNDGTVVVELNTVHHAYGVLYSPFQDNLKVRFASRALFHQFQDAVGKGGITLDIVH